LKIKNDAEKYYGFQKESQREEILKKNTPKTHTRRPGIDIW